MALAGVQGGGRVARLRSGSVTTGGENQDQVVRLVLVALTPIVLVGGALAITLVFAFVGVPILILAWPTWKRCYDIVRGDGHLGWWHAISYWMATLASLAVVVTFLVAAGEDLGPVWEYAIVVVVIAWLALMSVAGWVLWRGRPEASPPLGPALAAAALTPVVMLGAACTLSLWFIPVGVPLLLAAAPPWRQTIRTVQGERAISTWTIVATSGIAAVAVVSGLLGLAAGAGDLDEVVEVVPFVLLLGWVVPMAAAAVLLVRDRDDPPVAGTGAPTAQAHSG